MKRRCEDTEQCLAFNSNGEFKNKLKSRNHWVRTSESEGLYVAGEYPVSHVLQFPMDVCYPPPHPPTPTHTTHMHTIDLDLCSADLHSCGKHQDCTYTGS